MPQYVVLLYNINRQTCNLSRVGASATVEISTISNSFQSENGQSLIVPLSKQMFQMSASETIYTKSFKSFIISWCFTRELFTLLSDSPQEKSRTVNSRTDFFTNARGNTVEYIYLTTDRNGREETTFITR